MPMEDDGIDNHLTRLSDHSISRPSQLRPKQFVMPLSDAVHAIFFEFTIQLLDAPQSPRTLRT